MSDEGEDEARRYKRDPAVMSVNLGAGEIALLGPAQEKYYGLNDTAARIWELLESPRSAAELRAALEAEFDVAPEVCERETRRALSEMEMEKLIVAA